MTTICTDGRSIAGDGQRENNGTIVATTAEKVRFLKDGGIIGTAGDVSFGIQFIRWLNGEGEKPVLSSDGAFSALVLNPDGTVDLLDPEGVSVPVDSPAAIGSGTDFALGALSAGCSAVEAIEIAAKHDPHTGGKITSYSI